MRRRRVWAYSRRLRAQTVSGSVPGRCPGGAREAAEKRPGGAREAPERRPGAVREAPETVPEKAPIRRVWPSAAGGARNGKITAKPREERADVDENLAFLVSVLTMLQTCDC